MEDADISDREGETWGMVWGVGFRFWVGSSEGLGLGILGFWELGLGV